MLPFHINHGFKHFITYRDNLGVGLETTLGDNHIGEFVGDIDVGHFEGRRRYITPQCSCCLYIGCAGVIRCLIKTASCLRQTGCICKLCHGNLSFRLSYTIRISSLNNPRAIYGNRLQCSCRI